MKDSHLLQHTPRGLLNYSPGTETDGAVLLSASLQPVGAIFALTHCFTPAFPYLLESSLLPSLVPQLFAAAPRDTFRPPGSGGQWDLTLVVPHNYISASFKSCCLMSWHPVSLNLGADCDALPFGTLTDLSTRSTTGSS